MGKLPSFVRLPPNKKFEYNSRYYNAEKEELESRIRSAKTGQDNADVKERVSFQFRQVRYSSSLNKSRQKSNLRLIFIIIALSLLTYWLFYM